jgi:hypothetical protein
MPGREHIQFYPWESLKAKRGERFDFTFDEISYRASTIYRALVLELYLQAAHHLKKCAVA